MVNGFSEFSILGSALAIKLCRIVMRDCSLIPPPTLVCLKVPANIEKCTHKYFSHFNCILFLINILAILAYVKSNKSKKKHNLLLNFKVISSGVLQAKYLGWGNFCIPFSIFVYFQSRWLPLIFSVGSILVTVSHFHPNPIFPANARNLFFTVSLSIVD